MTATANTVSGYPAEIDVDLVELLEKARTHYGKAMQITSGLRCKKTKR